MAIDCSHFISLVDLHLLTPNNTRLSHASSYNGSMGSLASPTGQNRLGSEEAVDVFGLGFLSDQDDALSQGAPLFCLIGVEDNFAVGRPGGGWNALCQRFDLGSQVNPTVENLLKMLRAHTEQRLFFL